MSLDPAGAYPAGLPADPRFARGAEVAGDVPVTRVEVLTLAEGDRLLVHVDGAAGMSGGGASEIGERVRDLLKLGELPFDVPVLVVSPGIRVQVGAVVVNPAAVTARARQARLGAVLVWLVTGVFYVPGWLAGQLWFCIAWAGCAVAEGFTAGAHRPPDVGEPPG